MRTEPTAKSLQAEAKTLTLVVWPGEPAQRMVRRVRSDRVDQRARALAEADEKYPGAPRGWLNVETGAISLVAA